MARARGIKHGLYRNEELAECSVWARFIFPGLWMLADREGRIDDRPKRIRADLLPFDLVDVEPLLDELAQHGFIVRYQVDGKRYIQVVNFSRHQNPHGTEKDSEIPDEDGFYTVHERGKSGCITGTYEKVRRESLLSNGGLTVKPPLDNALIPDSCFLIPDSGGARRQAPEVIPRAGEKPQDEIRETASQADNADENPLAGGGGESPPGASADAIAARTSAITDLLRTAGAVIDRNDKRLRTWALRDVGDTELLAAMETARRRRDDAGSGQPVNAGLLDSILADGGMEAHGPPARASPGGKWAARERYAAQARAAGQRLGLDDEGAGNGRTGHDIDGTSCVVA